MPTVKEKGLDPNGNGTYPALPAYVSYARSIESVNKLQTELLRAKMERDLAQKRVSALESDLAAAQYVVDVLGAIEAP